VHDVANACGGDANFHCQGVLRNAEGDEKLLAQHLARMRRNSLQLSSHRWSFDRHFHPPVIGLVVIGDLNIVRSIVLPDKADAVLIVDP